MALNTAKIINVYYTKGDRKPYDVNGKPLSYLGMDYVGANEATEVRFYIGDDTGVVDAIADIKRADGNKAFSILTKAQDEDNEDYYSFFLEDWHTAKVGKLTIAFRAYDGEITINDGVIQANSLQIIVSDIFHIEIGYAPNSTEEAEAFDPNDVATFIAALSTKLDKANGINVVTTLPTPTGGSLNGHWYLVKSGDENQLGRLYVFDGDTPIAVELQAGGIKLTPTGNGELTADTGRLDWKQENGTAQVGLYNNVFAQLGEDVFYYVKAQGTITKGDVIQYAGYQGDHALAKRAVQSEVNNNPELIMGIAKQDIANGDFGYVAHFGKIESIDTKGVAVNSFVWFDSAGSTAGNWTITKPANPNCAILMAVIIKAESSGPANNGVMLVRPSITNINIEDIRNIELTSTENGNVLRYNTSISRWQDTADLTNAETDIANIEDGTTIVGKALGDQNGNTIDTTYLTIANGATTYVPLSSKGVANGVAPLGADNKILSIHLPGGVDDIKEFADLASFPVVGEASIIYVALDTNKIYRWGGSSYVEISSSLALGTTASTAFPGDRGLATETQSNNIVSGTQTLTNTRITNSDVILQALIVNGIPSTVQNLQEWRVDNGGRAVVTSSGAFGGLGLFNFSSDNNSNISTATTGTSISRNVNDLTNINPALTINQNQGLGDILRLQSAGANVLEITRTGGLNQNGTRLFSQPTATSNTFFGNESGGTSTTGTSNTSFGRRGLFSITSGTQNTSVGQGSGRSITTGSSNTFVGNDSGFTGAWGTQLATATNSTAIGNEAFTDKSNQMVFGNASVSEFVFNRNTGAEALLPRLTASSSGIHRVTRTSALTSESRTPLTIRHQTSDDMVTGFGTSLTFAIQDSANVENLIGSIQGVRTGADNSGSLFFTTYNAGTETTKMTILPDGKVGIGTASPAQQLTVVATSNTSGIQIRRNSVTANDYGVLGFRINTSELVGNFAEIRGVRTNRATDADTDLSFHTITGGTLGERLRIRDDGLVGINETSPSAQLVVKSGATNRVGLIIDSTATTGQTANIVEFRANNGLRATMAVNGVLSTNNGMTNLDGGSSFAYVNTSTNGTIISRNVATSDPALIVNSVQGTANIQVWQFGGNAKSQISKDGIFVGQTRPTRTDITANATLALGDEGKVLRVNPTTAADNITITIPKNSAVAFPVDTEIAIVRYNSGTVSIAPVDGDVTLQSANAERKIRNRYASVALKKIGTDEWVLVGSLEA